MSIELLSSALRTPGLTPVQKLTLVCLANYADEVGTCYPSHAHISELVGLKDPRGVRRVIKKLEDQGLLTIESRWVEQTPGRRRQTSNRYHLTIPSPDLGARGEGGHSARGGHSTRGWGVTEPPYTKDLYTHTGDLKNEPARRVLSNFCPEGFVPNEAMISGLKLDPAINVVEQLQMFKNHEFSQQKSDWDAAFLNWLRRTRPPVSPQGGSTADAKHENRRNTVSYADSKNPAIVAERLAVAARLASTSTS